MIIAKLNNRIVEIVKYAYDVRFSQDKGWLLINADEIIGKPNTLAVKWYPANTRFEWVKVFNFR